MSKQLLQEYFQLCPDGICALDTLTESEVKNMNNGSVYLVGVCQRAGTKNGNGRIYNKKTLQREVESYQKAIHEKRALGELDHPDDSVINLKNASSCSNLSCTLKSVPKITLREAFTFSMSDVS